MTTNSIRAGTLACLALLAAPSAAQAATAPPGEPMTYLALETSGGVLNPGVIVGFNPQPDPPGVPPVILANPFEPIFMRPVGPETFDFVMSFSGFATGLLLPAVQKPDIDGLTSFAFQSGGHSFDVTLGFSGPSAVSGWASFNPQPDPPGVWFADAVTFGATGDPSVSIAMTEDGVALRFAVPETGTWAMMGLGFATLGLLARRRGKRRPAFA
jgi:hypothetical protein